MSQLWDLWSSWWSGQQLSGAQLWGWPLVAWGRLGKVLQFLAGLTVVLDLIGPDPLRAFGRRLLVVEWGKAFTRPAELVAVVVAVVSLVGYLVLFVLSYFMEDLLPRISISETWFDTYYGLIAVIAFVILWTSLASLTVKGWEKIDPLPEPPESTGDVLVDHQNFQEYIANDKKVYRTRLNSALFLAPPLIAATILVTLLLLPWAVAVYGICLPASRGLAVLLDRSRPAHPLRWVAMGLFVAGFHFDLLAS